jgi:hypothetical protein
MGFSVGGALSGAIGGGLSGGGPGAIAGGLLGGFAGGAGDPRSSSNTSQQGTITDAGTTALDTSQVGTSTQNARNVGTNQQQVGNIGTSQQNTTNQQQTTNQQGTTGTGTTASTSGVAGYQLPYILQLMQGAQQNYLAPGSQVAPFNPTQQTGQALALQSAQGDMTNLAGQTAGTASFLQNPNLLNPATNPYLAASAQASLDPLVNALTRQVLPSIAGEAQSVEGVGSSRQGIAEGNAINQFQETAGNMLSNQYNAAYQNGLGTLLGAQAQAPGLANLLQQPSNVYNQIGALQQAQQQAQLNEAQQRLLNYQNLVGSQIYGQQSAGQTTSGQQTAGTVGTTGTTGTTGQTTSDTTQTGRTTSDTTTTGSTTQDTTQRGTTTNERELDLVGTGAYQFSQDNPLAEFGLGLSSGGFLGGAVGDILGGLPGVSGGYSNVMSPAVFAPPPPQFDVGSGGVVPGVSGDGTRRIFQPYTQTNPLNPQ